MRINIMKVLGLILLCFTLIYSASYIEAYFKASAYNKATGSHVTPWQAMNIPLRIVGTNTNL